MLDGKRILLVIGGGIAAYKCHELVRRLREQNVTVRCILTQAGAEFVQPLTFAALSGNMVYQDLFDLTNEAEMGHIQLSREADLVVVAPATADLIAKMAAGLANDLASTALLATDKPVLIAPAMNVRMWEHPATRRNLATVEEDGVQVVGPNEGPMACNEFGFGRMAEPDEIVAAVSSFFRAEPKSGRLTGRRALVTSGPTREAIDPVRYIANHSSGKQGHAIAAALADAGAETILVSGPTQLPDPAGVTTLHIESARDMLAECRAHLPVDVAVCAAAVADWRVDNNAAEKMKKDGSGAPPALKLVENPDILADLSRPTDHRPALVVGFAAETNDIVKYGRQKLARKGCDWILANDVSPKTGTFGGAENQVHLITDAGSEPWPRLAKADVARRLADKIANYFETEDA